MSNIGAMVTELIAAGCMPEVAARVIAEAFTAGVLSAPLRDVTRDERDERQREFARMRQQRRREKVTRDMRDKEGNSIKTNNITLRDVTRDEKVPLSNQVKKEEGKEERGAIRTLSRGHRLPDDWQPTPQDSATADALIGTHRVRSELEKFKDHWKQQPGSKGVKLDWDAAWRNWSRRAAEYQSGSKNGRRTVHDAARDLHEQTVAAVLAFDEPAPRGLCDGTGSDVIRLLPPGRRQ